MTETDEITSARERVAEQLMSDERILGALPDDASDVLLRWALARIDTAAQQTDDMQGFLQLAENVRHDARAIADQAAERGLDGDTLAQQLGLTETPAGAPAQAANATTGAEETAALREASSSERPVQSWAGRLRHFFRRGGGET